MSEYKINENVLKYLQFTILLVLLELYPIIKVVNK